MGSTISPSGLHTVFIAMVPDATSAAAEGIIFLILSDLSTEDQRGHKRYSTKKAGG